MRAEWPKLIHQEASPVAVGERIKQLRKEHGWSQDELAEKVGAAGAHQISRYENGQTMPSTETIVRLAEVLDISIDYLLIDGAPRRPLIATGDDFYERLGDLSMLTDQERDTIVTIVDALLTKRRMLAALDHAS